MSNTAWFTFAETAERGPVFVRLDLVRAVAFNDECELVVHLGAEPLLIVPGVPSAEVDAFLDALQVPDPNAVPDEAAA